MRFASSTLEMKGLHWKGSLGLFNQFHSRLKCTQKKKVTMPPNKPKFHPLESSDVQRNSPTMGTIKQRHRSHMCMTTGSPQPPLPQGLMHAKLSSMLPPFCFNIWQSNYWGGSCLAPERALTVTQLYRLCGAFICWQRYRRRSGEVSQGGRTLLRGRPFCAY